MRSTRHFEQSHSSHCAVGGAVPVCGGQVPVSGARGAGVLGGGRGPVPSFPPARSAAAGQVDGVSREGVVGALGHCASGGLLTGKGHQGLAAALAAEVVQQEDGFWQDLEEEDTTQPVA